MIIRAFLVLGLVFTLSGCPSGGSGSTGSGSGTFGSGAGSPPGDTGETASSFQENPLSSLCRTLSGTYFFGSNGGKLLTSSNLTSFSVLEGTPVDVNGVACNQTESTNSAWFVGAGGGIVTYDGSTLSSMESGVTEDLYGIYRTNSTFLYAVGDSGTILQNQGTEWLTQSSEVSTNLKGIDGRGAVSSLNLIVVGEDCTILQTSNGGTFWESDEQSVCQSVDVPIDTDLQDVWVDDTSGNIFVVGAAGTVLHYDTEWTRQAVSATSSALLAVHGVSATSAIAVGEDGVVLQYNGTGWTIVDNPAAEYGVRLTDVLMLSETSAIAIGAESANSNAEGFVMTWNGTAWSEASFSS